QASLEEIIEKNEIYVQKMEELFDKSLKLYEELIKEDVAKEIARIVLPLSLKTRFYWTVPLVSLDNFIKLRDSEHAQKEIKLYAEAIKEIINYKEKEEIIKDLFRRSYF
ncbi:MAG TPA: thymidylate synthase (FAD), partial [Nautiliaceae bacterium]|nr:thymidylate synthase (FAD) [Nautiliaceae bacterium]